MSPADLTPWILTYAVHSTVLLGAAWLLTRRSLLPRPAVADALWKAALIGGLVTATVHQTYAPASALWTIAARARAITEAPEARGTSPAGSDVMMATGAAAAPASSMLAGVSAGSSGGSERAGAASAAASVAAAAATNATGADAGGPIDSAAQVAGSLIPLAVAAWALFALFALARLGLAHIRLARWLAPRQPVEDPELVRMGAELGHAAGVSDVRLTWSSRIYSPVALGRREVCLPSAAFDELDAGQLRSVLAHEIAHLARRDPLWLALSVVLERVFFFQPLNRLARARMQEAAEFLCDEWAARESGSGITLATSLAHVAEWLGPAPPRPLPLAGMAESGSQLLRRVHRLMEPDVADPPARAWRPRLAALALVGMTALAVPGVGLVEHATGVVAAQQGGRPTDEGRLESLDISLDDLVITPRIELGKVELGDLELGDVAMVPDGIGRRNAAAPVSDTTRTRIVEALIGGLRDTDAQVRLASAEALGDLEDRRALPALAEALRDESSEVRHAAVHALGHLDDTAAVAPLISVLGDADPETRAEAAHALGNLGDRRATEPLLPLLRDASPDVRRAAIEALGDLGDPRAAGAAGEALEDPDAEVRQGAAEALGGFDLAAAPAQLLAALRDPVPDVQRSAAAAVGSIGDPRAVPVLREMLGSSDAELQEQAVDALGAIGTDEALEALVTAMRSTNPTVRRQAASALGRD